MARNQQHASLICGTRIVKTYLAKINNGKYRTLMVVMIFFSAWLSLHFVRATVEYHQQVVKDSVKEAINHIVKKDGGIDVISSTTEAFTASTEASTVSANRNKPNSLIGQLIHNHIKPNKQDSDMTSSTPYASSTTDFFELKRDIMGARPLDNNNRFPNIPKWVSDAKWDSSTESTTESSTTENIIGNTAANTNMNDQHLTIDSEQQFIVQPGQRDQANIASSFRGNINKLKNIDEIVSSTEYSTESTTRSMSVDIAKYLNYKATMKASTSDGTNLETEREMQSQFIQEQVISDSPNQVIDKQTLQANNSPDTNQNSPINSGLRNQNQVANVVVPQDKRPDTDSVLQTNQNSGQVLEPYQSNSFIKQLDPQLPRQYQPNNQPVQQQYPMNGQQINSHYQPIGQFIQQPYQYNGQQSQKLDQPNDQYIQPNQFNGQPNVLQNQPNDQVFQQPYQYNGQPIHQPDQTNGKSIQQQYQYNSQHQIQPNSQFVQQPNQYKDQQTQLDINSYIQPNSQNVQFIQKPFVGNEFDQPLSIQPPPQPKPSAVLQQPYNPFQQPIDQLHIETKQSTEYMQDERTLNSDAQQLNGNIPQNSLSSNAEHISQQADILEEEIQYQQQQIQQQQKEIQLQQQKQIEIQNQQLK